MTNGLGVWKAEECALVLIDYQNEMFEVIRSETDADLVELHVRLLARTARAYNVTDAVGGRSQVAHRTAIDRLAHAGAVPTTALAVVTELFRDWASSLAGPAREVIYWYFGEVPRHTDQVGVAEAEKLAAAQTGQ